MSDLNATNSNFSVKLQSQLRLLLVIVLSSITIGSAVAFFLWLLSAAIHFRFKHTWLLYLLPLAGLIIHLAYKLYGKSSEKGNNLIIDEIHQPGAGVPKRLGPLILFTTVLTHLFGGSAGREGTAVQIGGSIAHWFGSLFKLEADSLRIVLTAGIAAGFGAVFGTPLTGAVFAIEVLTVGRMKYDASLACLIAGYIGDVVVAEWHIKHTAYHIGQVAFLSTGWHTSIHIAFIGLLIVKIIIASIAFGLASLAFAEATHNIKKTFLKLFKYAWMIPVCGGLIIIGLTAIIGKPDYLSLGVEPEYSGAITIVSAFQHGGADLFSWFWKLIYTAITLGTGFKGGEVTPLFYIGATLGNILAAFLNAPVSLFAALGFIAVFSGATKTPIACSIMGMELFGPQYTVFFVIACFIAYLFSGRSGIYSSQRRPGEPPVSYLKEKLSKYSPW